MQPMNDISFEAALGERVEDMLDACTRCGKCVAVCPSVKPAGIAGASSEDIISGVLDIVRTGDGPEASRKWAASCMLSGECIKACDYGVNPRFLLAMTRLAIAKAESELPDRRRLGVERYRDLSRDVNVLSRLQLDGEMLERLGQKSAAVSTPAEAPDFVFYTGCNVLKTPHIALLALDIMDALGITYQVMGGPSHCCGVMQLRPGDVEMSGRMGSNSIEKLSHSKSGQVISWCPSCYVQFTELTLPTIERQRGGSRPFEMTPFMRFLDGGLAFPYYQPPGGGGGEQGVAREGPPQAAQDHSGCRPDRRRMRRSDRATCARHRKGSRRRRQSDARGSTASPQSWLASHGVRRERRGAVVATASHHAGPCECRIDLCVDKPSTRTSGPPFQDRDIKFCAKRAPPGG